MSLSCSKFDFDGNVIPINRNYDVLIFEIHQNDTSVCEAFVMISTYHPQKFIHVDA